MNGDIQQRHRRGSDKHLRERTDALKESLRRCAADPDVDAVHDTRTGTRRIEAALESALPPTDGDEELRKAVRAWQRLLKKIRRAAAPVRDLDVQQKLLKKLIPKLETKAKTPVNEPKSGMAAQVEKLDHALKGEREMNAAPLRRNAAKWAAKLDGHYETLMAARHPAMRRRKPDAAVTALNEFARLSTHMRQLDAGNLHDFRKGAKKARYMAEAGGENERAGMVGRALKKLQDEIGDWHDWLMLADEAHRFLGADGATLTAEIERRRDEHYERAMKVAEKMRGRLMGEWLADSPSRQRPRAAAPVGRGRTGRPGVGKPVMARSQS
jgi:CHAD domain-containing protein